MTKSSQHRQRNDKNHANRALHLEYLESRELLSVVSPTADAEDLTENVSAFISTVDPAANTCFVEMDLASQESSSAPLAVNLEIQQVQVVEVPVALEANNTAAAQKIVVNTVDDTVNNDRYTSLREAIQNATDGAIITFARSLKGKTINVSRTLTISKGITIDASSLYDAKNDEPGLTIKMTGDSYAITINGSKSVTIKGIGFTSSYSYRGISCVGKSGCVANIQNCTFLQPQ